MYTRCWLVDNSVCANANDYNNDGGGYIVAGVEEAQGIAVRPVKGIRSTCWRKIKMSWKMS